MMKRTLRQIGVIGLAIGLVACNGVEYDPKALGFADKAEMETAFAKGYHTKLKFAEMVPQAAQPKVEAPAPAPVPPQAVTPQVPAQQEPIAQAPVAQEPPKAAEPPKVEPAPSKDVAEAATCADVKACVNAMLASAKVENLTAAMDAARRIDEMPKPERGDRKVARKLNDEGLAAFKQGKNLEAINLLTKAREADKLDEEIHSNLVYVYSEDGNHAKAVALSIEGFILNPRRSSLWMPYAVANAKLGKQSEALQALWLAWQFSANKEKMLASIDKKIAEEQDAVMKSFYATGKAWLVENKKPNL
jgi:tetratricopeptide (TPR) repeat protein